ncbi:MAG TPA: nucleotide disphospho-sugar-binding domain-containing protein [Pseudonocardiaceae bacterium]|nr:nucleotide disphospho-sugar-binding domain-containing protein [Pseudonocardiaceae bacterium]
MSRYLFVSLPLAGHVNPAAALANQLVTDGHEVAWAGSELMLRPMLGQDAVILRTGSRLFREQGGAGIASIRSLWARFIVPYAKFILPGVDRAVREFQPDVLVVDQHAIGGALVAERHGLPWATLAVSAMELTQPYRDLPKLVQWQQDQLVALWTGAGLPVEDYCDLLYSPHLVLAQTTSALTGPLDTGPHVRLVGPLTAERPAPSFPYQWLDPDRKHVLVTMGTLADDLSADFYHRALAALGPFGDTMQVIVVAPPSGLPSPPDNTIVVPRVPLLPLLPHIDTVVGHAGVNTTSETLAAGVPLVLAPIRHDQPEMARQVVAAGAGVRVRFRRVRPAELATAVTTVLGDPSYRANAVRIGESFRAAGGTAEAALCLAGLQQTMSDRRRSLSGAG